MSCVAVFDRAIVLENRSIADLEAYSNLYMLSGHESTVWFLDLYMTSVTWPDKTDDVIIAFIMTLPW